MKKNIGILLIVTGILLSGCSTMAKVSAGAATPVTAALDTALAPVQLIGDAGKGLIYLGDRHQEMVYEANKDSVTLPLAQLTTLIFYIPGYVLLPIDSITPRK